MIPKIQMKGVYKSFGDNHVLKGVDLSIGKGRSMVVIGGSGTGKSVTIKLILGLLSPDKGQILIDGKDAPIDMRKVGMLFQGGALFDSICVWRNVAFGLMQGAGMPANKAKKIALEKLAAVGLDSDVAKRMPAELSGGMQKRVALARAIAAEPEILFFDEPTTGLDPIRARDINKLIRQCVVDLGVSAITITHDISSMRHIADDVAMLKDGKIIWSGDIKSIDSCGNETVLRFIDI